MSQHRRRRRLPHRRAVVAASVAFAALCATLDAPGATASALSIHGSRIVVTMHGEGHGHGLSQYGARGAAIAGKSFRQILAFYYPHTTLANEGGNSVRVLLSGAGRTTTVGAASQLAVTGVAGTLPTAGVRRYRLIAGAGTKDTLQRLASTAHAKWTTIRTGLPNAADFGRNNFQPVRLYRADGTSTAYFGRLRAVRVASAGASAGVLTVNHVSLNSYTAGVTPREMPAYWQRAALAAQAVAVRTYARYAVEHPRSRNYDICDTTMCQVYGGQSHYSAGGTRLWVDDRQASADTSRKILTYGHVAIFAQFSASNGGWSTSGGKPYLVARPDPFDNRASGDPFLSYDRTVSSASVAGYYGLSKITSINITRRDGHGVSGGRVIAAYVTGSRVKGSATRLSTDGDNLNWALHAGTSWFTLRNA